MAATSGWKWQKCYPTRMCPNLQAYVKGGTKECGQTFRDGRGERNKDFEVGNLGTEKPWFGAEGRQCRGV
jgi:hypothetical protein